MNKESEYKFIVSSPLIDEVYSKEYGILHISKGTLPIKPYTFAGKGSNKPLRAEHGLISRFGGQQGQWSHGRHTAYIDVNGESKRADVHWFYEPSVGYVGANVKYWYDDKKGGKPE